MMTLIGIVALAIVILAVFFNGKSGKALFNKVRIADAQAAAALSNPVENAALEIADAEREVNNFQTQVRDAMASNKLLAAKRDKTKQEVAKFAALAKEALLQGNEDDAKEALEKKQKFEKVVTVLTEDIAKNDSVISTQRSNLESAKDKIESAATNKDILAVRYQGAKLRDGLAQQNVRFGSDGSALASLDNLEDEVQKIEARAEATEDLGPVPRVWKRSIARPSPALMTNLLS